jgi:hypothetical protein
LKKANVYAVGKGVFDGRFFEAEFGLKKRVAKCQIAAAIRPPIAPHKTILNAS